MTADWDFYVKLPITGIVGCKVCTKAMWEAISRKKAVKKDISTFFEEYVEKPVVDYEQAALIREYVKTLRDIKHEFMDILEVPEDIPDNEIPCKLNCYTQAEHLVYKHTGVDFIRQSDVDIITWWQWAADAYKYAIVYNLGDEGKKQLNSCWYYMHDEIDRATLRGLMDNG